MLLLNIFKCSILKHFYDEVINFVDMSAKNKFSQVAKMEFILYVHMYDYVFLVVFASD